MVLEEPDEPTKSLKNLPDSGPNQFIRFRRTDFRKNAGQSIVPFFDGQMIGRSEPPPLGGIGVYHRGCKGFGGFLAFRIFDANLSRLLVAGNRKSRRSSDE